jgi:hypothetical protein
MNHPPDPYTIQARYDQRSVVLCLERKKTKFFRDLGCGMFTIVIHLMLALTNSKIMTPRTMTIGVLRVLWRNILKRSNPNP